MYFFEWDLVGCVGGLDGKLGVVGFYLQGKLIGLFEFFIGLIGVYFGCVVLVCFFVSCDVFW